MASICPPLRMRLLKKSFAFGGITQGSLILPANRAMRTVMRVNKEAARAKARGVICRDRFTLRRRCGVSFAGHGRRCDWCTI